jgi:carboxymethylenebutenolidase
MIVSFTHTLEMTHEHIYWDQASVLKQIGLLTDPNLPICGIEATRKLPAGPRSL